MLYETPGTHDLQHVGGKLRTESAFAAQKAQKIKARLLTVRGEWFLDTGFGLDYRGIVFVKSTPRPVLAAHIRRVMLRAAGEGSEITEFDMSFDSSSRRMTITASIRLSTGEVVQAGNTLATA